MKRYFYLTAAIAGLLMAASCQKEDFAVAEGDYAEVSFTADLPGAATKAIADGQTVNKLYYEVYTVETDGVTPVGEPVYDATTDVDAGKATVNVRLIKNKPYTVFFWAQYEDNNYTSPYTVTDLKNVSVSYDNALANDEKRDAFYAVAKGVKYAGATTETIELTRPFAQVNVATSDVDILTRDGVSLTRATSTLTVTNVANTFSMFDGKATAENLAAGETELDASFTAAAIPAEKLYNVGADNKSYDYLAMAYILVPNASGEGTSTSVSTITSEVTVTELEGPVTISYEGATVQQNRRTNLVGQLLTTSADYMVEVDNKFNKPEHDYEYENVTNVDAANAAFASGNTTSVRIEEITEAAATVILPQTADEVTVLLPETEATVTFDYPADAAETPDVLNITAPEGTSIVLNVENTTVYINGVLQTVTSATASNTLYVTEGTVIENLIVVKGNVRIEKGGVVKNISLSDDAEEKLTVNVYLGEGVETPTVAEEDKDQITLIPFTTPETEDSFVDQVAATKYGKVTLTEDVVLEDALTITAEQDITIDLNGFSISQEKVQDTGYSMIVNNGKLTINDSGKEGSISYADTGNGGEYVSNTILNNGTLIINDGIIVNNSTKTVSANGYPHPIDNNARLIINGGTMTNNADYSSLRIWCTTDDNTYVEINGGTFNGSIDFHNVNKQANKGTLKIYGGTFNADTYTKSATRVLGFGADVDEINGYIYGGTFNGEIALRNWSNSTLNSNVYVIYGGTFSSPTALNFLASDADISLNADMGITKTINLDGGKLNGNSYGISGTLTDYSTPAILTTGGTIQNLSIVTGCTYSIAADKLTNDLYIDNVKTANTGYGMNLRSQTAEYQLFASNSTFLGWSSLTGLTQANFTNCYFGQGRFWADQGYADVFDRLLKPYVNTVFTDCEFEKGFYIDLSSYTGTSIKFVNCTVDGVKLTKEMFKNSTESASKNQTIDELGTKLLWYESTDANWTTVTVE